MALLNQISTGSNKGNCYQYNSLLLDIGVSFSKIKGIIDEIDIIFISHVHKDHLRADTIEKVYRHRPEVLFIGGANMKPIFEELKVKHYILELGKSVNFAKRGYEFELIKLYHDVENYGLKVKHDNLLGGYITDTKHVEGISLKNCDWLIIEYNHDEVVVREAIAHAKDNNKFTHLVGAVESHLSFQKADPFINENAKNGTEILKCHLGSSLDPFYYDLHYIHET